MAAIYVLQTFDDLVAEMLRVRVGTGHIRLPQSVTSP